MYNLLKKHRRAFNAANNNFGAANIVRVSLKKLMRQKSKRTDFAVYQAIYSLTLSFAPALFAALRHFSTSTPSTATTVMTVSIPA